MGEQTRTVTLTEDEWAAVEVALLSAARKADDVACRIDYSDDARDMIRDRWRTLMVAVRAIQVAGTVATDGGPVGSARYIVR